MAATGRAIAYKGPSKAYDTAAESTPVSGVETKNEIVAGFEAPALLSAIAAGITPQEQRGSGAPITADLAIADNFELPMCLCNKEIGTRTCITPATSNPMSNHSDDAMNSVKKFSIKRNNSVMHTSR